MFFYEEVIDMFPSSLFPAIEPEPVKLPEIPPEVWNTRPIDGQKCVEATRALCG